MKSIDEILSLANCFEKTASTQYAYHIRSDDFRGKTIYPLAELEEAYPKIYKTEIKKYRGRESHPNIKVSLLDARWADCVCLSTLDPRKIFQLEDLLGIDNQPAKIFRFKISDLKDFDMCIFNDDDKLSPRKDEAYDKITAKSYKETKLIPPETVKYFVRCKKKGEQPLLFSYIPHLMIKGSIPINLADIV